MNLRIHQEYCVWGPHAHARRTPIPPVHDSGEKLTKDANLIEQVAESAFHNRFDGESGSEWQRRCTPHITATADDLYTAFHVHRSAYQFQRAGE